MIGDLNMNVIGKVLEVATNQTIAKNGGGSYKGTRLTYRDSEGAIKEKCIHENALKYNPTLKNQLSELSGGDDFTMVMEKEGDFWNIKGITKGVVENDPSPATVGNGKTSATSSNPSPRSTYETPEERAKKQVLIVRQSSVTSAIAYSATLKTPLPINEILKTAEQITAFVFQSDFDDGSIESLPSDNID